MSAYLNSANSLCKQRQKIIISQENRLKHIAKNVNQSKVRHYKVDGDVITDNKTVRCDYLVLNDDKKAAYFIELKGVGGINKTMEQIISTIKLLKNELPSYTECRKHLPTTSWNLR